MSNLPRYRLWAIPCPFRRNGSPVVGTSGKTIRNVILLDADTWHRLCRDIPALAATQFEVGTFEDLEDAP